METIEHCDDTSSFWSTWHFLFVLQSHSFICLIFSLWSIGSAPSLSLSHLLSLVPSLSSAPFLHSVSWSSGAPRWPRRDGAERSSFRQRLDLSYMGERSQGPPTRTPWASRAPRTSRCVCAKRDKEKDTEWISNVWWGLPVILQGVCGVLKCSKKW